MWSEMQTWSERHWTPSCIFSGVVEIAAHSGRTVGFRGLTTLLKQLIAAGERSSRIEISSLSSVGSDTQDWFKFKLSISVVYLISQYLSFSITNMTIMIVRVWSLQSNSDVNGPLFRNHGRRQKTSIHARFCFMYVFYSIMWVLMQQKQYLTTWKTRALILSTWLDSRLNIVGFWSAPRSGWTDKFWSFSSGVPYFEGRW
jgi:hypothetical protein